MKRTIQFLLLFFLLVIYIYSIVFQFFQISTKIILEAVGLLLCTKYIASNKYILKKEYRNLLGTLMLLVIWDGLTSLINGGSEFYLANKIVQAIGSIFAAQIIYSLFKRISSDRIRFYYIVIIVILAESLLALFMKLLPPLNDLVQSILYLDIEEDLLESFLTYRIVGIGNATFFGVMASCTLALMTIMYLLLREQNKKLKVFLVFSWFVIFSVSFFSARYSLFIGLLSVVYYFVCSKVRKSIRLIGLAVLVLFGIYSTVSYYADDVMVRWAFGTFTGDDDGGQTTNILKSWWKDSEFGLKTLLIGDAKYSGINGDVYYKAVDIGILRQIYYGGIIGLMLNLYAHARALKHIYINNKEKVFKRMLFFLMVSYIVMLTKGDASMLSFFILYLVVETEGVFKKVR